MSPRLVMRWMVLILLLVGCAPPAPQPTARLASRLIIDNGTGAVMGRIVAPSSLVSNNAGSLVSNNAGSLISNNAGSYRVAGLNETVVTDAIIEVVDAGGHVNAAITPVHSNSFGQFALQDVPIGESTFVRVKFKGKDGQSLYLYAYVRPQSEESCVEVSLPSSVVAQKIARNEALIPVYDPDKVDQVITEVRSQIDASADLPPEGGTADPFQDLVTADSPAGDATTPPVFDQIVAQNPSLDNHLQKAVDTYLLINVRVQAMGQNLAPFPGRDATRHLLIGKVELTCTAAGSNSKGIVFTLNGQTVATTSAEAEGWRGVLDTRPCPDGDYLLTAHEIGADGNPGVTLVKSFVRILNQPATHSPCETKWRDGP
ncbi:MAG TPA: hypothetical protein V6D05_17155 [Stenomitos sp.]